MIWLFLVLLSLVQPGDHKLFRLEKLGPDYYKFLNHGFKAGQVTREQAKLKVDILGQVLKKHVTQLRSGEFFLLLNLSKNNIYFKQGKKSVKFHLFLYIV